MCASAAPLVLASASARRRELLTSAGISHQVIVSSAPEDPRPGEDATSFAVRVARAKAECVAKELRQSKDLRPVLAADTVVTIDGAILGKPRDRQDAGHMIGLLAGREHRVITAYCILSPRGDSEGAATTSVIFRALDSAQIERYLDRAEWGDKAGAYAIQGEASSLVLSIRGSHSNVIGLPLCEVVEALSALPGFEDIA